MHRSHRADKAAKIATRRTDPRQPDDRGDRIQDDPHVWHRGREIQNVDATTAGFQICRRQSPPDKPGICKPEGAHEPPSYPPRRNTQAVIPNTMKNPAHTQKMSLGNLAQQPTDSQHQKQKLDNAHCIRSQRSASTVPSNGTQQPSGLERRGTPPQRCRLIPASGTEDQPTIMHTSVRRKKRLEQHRKAHQT